MPVSKPDAAAISLMAQPVNATLSTIDGSGGPRAVPIWFRYDDGKILIWTKEDRAWVRHLQRDPRCAFAVYNQGVDLRGVLIRGQATITTTDDSWVHEEARRICERYMPPGELEAYLGQYPDLRTIVTIEPEWIRSW